MEKIRSTVFVTGVTGFVGKSFLSQLLFVLDSEAVVYVLTREMKDFQDSRVVPLVGSLEEVDVFKEQLLNSQFVYHLAAEAGYKDDIKYFDVNTEPTKVIVNILKEAKALERFVFVSTIGAVDRAANDNCSLPIGNNNVASPTTKYGKSKLEAEKYIIASGLPYTIIRPTWVYGAGMRVKSHLSQFVSWIYEKKTVIRLNFPGMVSVIHVEDLSRALVNCLFKPESKGKIYFAETESFSIGKIFAIFYEQIKGNPLRQIFLPKLNFIFGRIHSKLPLSINNLFVDYLFAKDSDFKSDLLDNNNLSLETHAFDVIKGHISNSGYWVITGANSGIGYELACRFHAAGKKLILVDKQIDKILSFGKQRSIKADLSIDSEIATLASQFKQYRICGLINNAGLGFKGNFESKNISGDNLTVDVNIKAPLALTKALLPVIIKNNGVIVNIASSAAFGPLPGMSVYSASKAFILQWSSALWYELKNKCLVITCSPSGTNTSFQSKAGVVGNSGGLLKPEVIAEEIFSAIKKRKPFVFVGLKNKLVISIIKIFPIWLQAVVWGHLFKKMR